MGTARTGLLWLALLGVGAGCGAMRVAPTPQPPAPPQEDLRYSSRYDQAVRLGTAQAEAQGYDAGGREFLPDAAAPNPWRLRAGLSDPNPQRRLLLGFDNGAWPFAPRPDVHGLTARPLPGGAPLWPPPPAP